MYGVKSDESSGHGDTLVEYDWFKTKEANRLFNTITNVDVMPEGKKTITSIFKGKVQKRAQFCTLFNTRTQRAHAMFSFTMNYLT